MSAAVASDLAAGRVEVFGIRDATLNGLPAPLDRFRAVRDLDDDTPLNDFIISADYVLFISPDRGLYVLAEGAELCGTALLSPGKEFVAWATDKHATSETLRAAGVPAPRGVRLE